MRTTVDNFNFFELKFPALECCGTFSTSFEKRLLQLLHSFSFLLVAIFCWHIFEDEARLLDTPFDEVSWEVWLNSPREKFLETLCLSIRM